jgi:hypothetical protein
MRLRLFLFIIISLLVRKGVCQEQAWIPQIESLRGKLDFLQSLTTTLPNLPTANLQYRRNVVQVLDPVQTLINSLGDNAADLTIQPTKIEGIEFWSEEPEFDQQRISDLKTSLISSLKKINLDAFTNLRSDILVLKKNTSEAGDDFSKNVKRLLMLAPFIYDSSGTVVVDSAQMNFIEYQINSATPNEFSNLYDDLYKNHQSSVVLEASKQRGMGQLLQIHQNVVSKFIGVTIHSSIAPKPRTGSRAEKRVITVEKVSSIVALYRGATSGDCSILSVPYYPLVKGVEVFWIRKDYKHDKFPAGYALVAQVEVDGKTLPYVITINGVTLSYVDTRAVVQLLAKKYDTNEVIVPDFGQNQHVVNYDNVRQGMTYKKSDVVTVRFPIGWNIVEQHTNQYGWGNDTNYYRADRIGQARKVNVKSEKIDVINRHETTTFLPINKSKDVSTLSILDSAILANHVLGDIKSEDEKHEILKDLGISDHQVVVASYLLNAKPKSPLTMEQFNALKSAFGFKLNDINKLDVLTRAHSFPHLFPSDRYGERDQREKIAQSINLYLDRGVIGSENSIEAVTAYFEAKSQLPVSLIPGYYTSIRTFLLSSNDSIQTLAVEFLLKNKWWTDDVVNELPRILAIAATHENFYFDKFVGIATVNIKNRESETLKLWKNIPLEIWRKFYPIDLRSRSTPNRLELDEILTLRMHELGILKAVDSRREDTYLNKLISEDPYRYIEEEESAYRIYAKINSDSSKWEIALRAILSRIRRKQSELMNEERERGGYSSFPSGILKAYADYVENVLTHSPSQILSNFVKDLLISSYREAVHKSSYLKSQEFLIEIGRVVISHAVLNPRLINDLLSLPREARNFYFKMILDGNNYWLYARLESTLEKEATERGIHSQVDWQGLNEASRAERHFFSLDHFFKRHSPLLDYSVKMEIVGDHQSSSLRCGPLFQNAGHSQ